MKKKKLAILASCMVLCSSGFGSVVYGEEASAHDTVLEEVVVTGFKDISPVKYTVITEEDIKAKGAQNVADALKDVAGLTLNGNNAKGKKNAQIRGSDADNTKIFVDGVPLSPVGDGRVDLRSIPADNIEKIEVIKGAVPVIYGSDAPGGVIYITTKKAGKSTQSLTITTGSKNSETFFTSIGGKLGEVRYSFGAKREETDGYTVHSKLTADYFNGKLSWDINSGSSLTLFGSSSRREEELPNRIDPATGEIIRNPAQGGTIAGRNNYWTNTYNWEYDPLKNSYIGAMFNQKLNEKSDLSLKVYQSKEYSHIKAFGGWREEMFDIWDGRVRGWELQNTWRTSPVNTATWGLTQETRKFTERLTNFTLDGYNTAYYDHKDKSFYLQDVTKVNSRLSTSVGYRHNENTDHALVNTIAYQNTDGRITAQDTSDNGVASFAWALSGKTTVHGSVGTSYKWPNAKERSSPGGWYPNGIGWGGTGDPNTRWAIMPDGTMLLSTMDKSIEPEEAINREVGISSSLKSLAFDITFFKKDIDNMIKGQGFSQGHSQYYNIPHVDMKGYEMEVHHNIGRHTKAYLNYTYTNALDTQLKQQVRDVPYRKYSYGLNYKGTDGINANLAISYVGACTSIFSNGNGNGDGEQWSDARYAVQNLPSYKVVDLKVSKVKDNRDYWVKITNLFDEKYYQGAYLIAPGRFIEAGTTIKF